MDRHGKTHRQILFIGEDQEQSISELILIQHPLKFLTGLTDTLSVVRVDDKDNSLSVLKVMAPKGTNLVLTTNIPHSEGNVLVLDSLDVKAWWAQSLATILTKVRHRAIKMIKVDTHQ